MYCSEASWILIIETWKCLICILFSKSKINAFFPLKQELSSHNNCIRYTIYFKEIESFVTKHASWRRLRSSHLMGSRTNQACQIVLPVASTLYDAHKQVIWFKISSNYIKATGQLLSSFEWCISKTWRLIPLNKVYLYFEKPLFQATSYISWRFYYHHHHHYKKIYNYWWPWPSIKYYIIIEKSY